MSFIYPNATPELLAYLDSVYNKAWDSDNFKRMREQKEKISKEEYEDYQAKRKEWDCREEAITRTEEVRTSPCGKYSIVITHHKVPVYVDHSVGKVFRGDELITTIKRSYNWFFSHWFGTHANGHEYLICGEDLSGQTIIELDTGKRIDYSKDAFIWEEITKSPSTNGIAVYGEYWGATAETFFFDFSEPMSPPWGILGRSDYTGRIEWKSENSCIVHEKLDIVDLPGHPLNGKSEYELSFRDGDYDEIEAEIEKRGLVETPEKDDPGFKETEVPHLWEKDPLNELKFWLKNIKWRRGNGWNIREFFIAQVSLQLTALIGSYTDLNPEEVDTLRWVCREASGMLSGPLLEVFGQVESNLLD